jgi:hypothetical protein
LHSGLAPAFYRAFGVKAAAGAWHFPGVAAAHPWVGEYNVFGVKTGAGSGTLIEGLVSARHFRSGWRSIAMPTMAKRRKQPKAPLKAANDQWLKEQYLAACHRAEAREYEPARELFEKLAPLVSDPKLKAQILNDLATLAVIRGDVEAGRSGFQAALAAHDGCKEARANLAFLDEEGAQGDWYFLKKRDEWGNLPPYHEPGRTRVAILSFLFNWPTSGGGNIHTVELAHFLSRAGYRVAHWYAR